MGNQLSGTSIVTPRDQLLSIHFSSEELRCYDDSVRNDQDVRKFDEELQTRTTHVIDTLAAGIKEPLSFSFELLREVTGSLLETDQRVVENLEIILSGEKDIWRNKVLSSLVDDYFKTSLHTLDFCIAIEKCLTIARDRQTILNAGIQRLADTKPGEDEYKKAMEDLERFKSVDTHFTGEMLEMFSRVYCEHLQMLQSLQTQRIQLDKKLKKVKSLRKTANIIFAATFATVLICSVVVAALAAPPLVIAVVAAAAAAWAPTERWFSSLWKGYVDVVKEQKEVISSMQAGSRIAIRDLDHIRILVEQLMMESTNSFEKIDNGFIVEEKNGVQLVVQEIKNKISIFNSNLDELGLHVDNCSRNIRRARSVVLQRIMKSPT